MAAGFQPGLVLILPSIPIDDRKEKITRHKSPRCGPSATPAPGAGESNDGGATVSPAEGTACTRPLLFEWNAAE